MYNKIKKILTPASALFTTISIKLGGVGGVENPAVKAEGNANPFTSIGSIASFLIWLAVALAILKIVIGGIKMVAGGASESTRTDGKEDVSAAIWGLVLALATFLILRAVNPAILTTFDSF